jgi:hypothetical protein
MLTRVGADGTVHAVKEDGARERIQLKAGRLLACDEHGSGIHYRFIGYRPGRRYRTYAYVVAVAEKTLTLVLPEWHPARTVSYPRRLVPEARQGRWLQLTADLGQSRAGGLNPADILSCPDPGADWCRRPDDRPVKQPAGAPLDRPVTLGRSCGDIVLESPPPRRPSGTVELHVIPHVDLQPGARAYLPDGSDGQIASYLDVIASRPTPNGTRIRCRVDRHALERPIPIPGPLVSGRWRWRWWPRDLERAGVSSLADAFTFDPVEHCDDIRWPSGAPRADQETPKD